MEVPQATARWLAPASLIFNFGAQIYGILSSPSLKEINDANVSFFSPQVGMVGLFFFSQQMLQLAWVYKLSTIDSRRSEEERVDSSTVLSYVPYQVLGNISIGVWVFFWNASALKTANMFVCINLIAQVYFVLAQLDKMNLNSRASMLTHLAAKTCVGVSVLDVLHNTSIAYFKDEEAGTLVYAFAALVFGVGALLGDWIIGSCMIYVAMAMAAGQSGLGSEGWSRLLWVYAAVTAVIVVGKNLLK